MFAVGTNLASVSAFAVVLLVLGTALELLALEFARRASVMPMPRKTRARLRSLQRWRRASTR